MKQVSITPMRMGILVFAILMMSMMIVTTTGCTSKGGGEDTLANDTTDSIAHDTTKLSAEDSLIIATPMPKRADELFDDFFFNFYVNSKLQRNRIVFPLTVQNGGEKTFVQKNEWQMEHFFRHDEFYSVIAGSQKALHNAADTTVKDVMVEKIMFRDQVVRQFEFKRLDGQWKMLKINNVAMQHHPDGSFLQFLYSFTTDEEFQQGALAERITYVGPDEEDESKNITRTINNEDWSNALHVLPDNYDDIINKGMYDVVYGNNSKESSIRVVSFRGVANGDEIRYTFKKSGGNWKLVKYEM